MSLEDLVREIERKNKKEKTVAESLRGSVGGTGVAGKDGKDGVDGRKGFDGLDGVDGDDGINGVDGKDGKDGVDGRDGKDGKNAVDGRDGVDGSDGRDGVDGREGNPGSKGVKGDSGSDGRDGHDGLDGLDGVDAPVIVKIEKNKSNELIVHLDNDQKYNVGKLPKGPKGDAGKVVRQMGGGGTSDKAYVHEQLQDYIPKSIGTTKGDVQVFDGSDWVRLGVGSDADVVTADSAEDVGVKWAAPIVTDTSNLVPYTGADANVELGEFIVIQAQEDLVWTRDANNFSTLITRGDSSTITLTRNGDNQITSYVDSRISATYTLTRNGDGFVTNRVRT